MRWWLGWVAAFYVVWAILTFGFGYWGHVKENWPIAAAMALGSYVAGSTPMGGGTVGFPVLVLLFDMPPSLGRNFGLLIQSIGMTSATIFILCRRIPVEYGMLIRTIPSAAIGLVLGTFLVVPRVSDVAVKLIFACLWASFGVLTLLKNREMCDFHGRPVIPPVERNLLSIAVGLFGGITAALTGVGIDMLLYTLLVLLYRMDLKIAVPTSVMIMAAASLMGTALHVAIGDLSANVYHSWLAASPVVILGAPLGAYIVTLIPRIYTLYFVAVLCVFQFFWALWVTGPTPAQWLFVAVNLVIAMAGFRVLYSAGKRRAARG
ncbi:MAG: sulfite exporter TauE/SafE family protein [Bryobacteraceae bacterium]